LDTTYLFRNLGNGKFRELAAEVGIQEKGFNSSAAWVDYDRDGRLDLFVCHYVRWSPATDFYGTVSGGMFKSYTQPEVYPGDYNHLYRNSGNGKFQNVSARAGIHHARSPHGMRRLLGKALGVAICDYNRDNWPDIIVTNDTEPNFVFKNQGDGTFAEVGTQTGLALPESGLARAGMGVDAGDFDNNGSDDIVVGNFDAERLGLYRNEGNSTFNDIAFNGEVGRASAPFLTFGCFFLDVDNDGWLDILATNGHVLDDIQIPRPQTKYAQRPLLFHNQGNSRFNEVAELSGTAMSLPIVGRGLACADVDLDGNIDVLFATTGGSPVLVRNDGGNRLGVVRLVLQGTRSNRSGIGAHIEAKVGKRTLYRTVRSGSSYLSQSELPITLGLGNAPAVDSVTIRWPSGQITKLTTLKSGAFVKVDEERGLIERRSLDHPHAQ
jgi:hypothetical protein